MAAAEGYTPKTCRYIEGEARDLGFCEKPVQKGSSYCPEHHKLCYKKITLNYKKPKGQNFKSFWK